MTPYNQFRSPPKINPHNWLIIGVARLIGVNLLEALLKINKRAIYLDNFATGHQPTLEDVRNLVFLSQRAKFYFIKSHTRNLGGPSIGGY